MNQQIARLSCRRPLKAQKVCIRVPTIKIFSTFRFEKLPKSFAGPLKILFFPQPCRNAFPKAAERMQKLFKSHLMFQLGCLIILMALGNDSFLLLHGRQLTFDDGVKLFANIVLNVHLMIHDFICYCLLEFCCLFRRVSQSRYAFPDELK